MEQQNKETVSPIMKKFFELKAKHPDAILLFRVGDFYETYCKDAEDASEILGITRKKRTGENNYYMAGFPYHALDTYLPKLIRAGHRVAICDQLEDPKTTKKQAKRGITEITTPTNLNSKGQSTMVQEEYKQQATKLVQTAGKEFHKQKVELIRETIKALDSKLPAQLNAYFAEAIGTVEFIKVKHELNATITREEIQFLIKQAEVARGTV